MSLAARVAGAFLQRSPPRPPAPPAVRVTLTARPDGSVAVTLAPPPDATPPAGTPAGAAVLAAFCRAADGAVKATAAMHGDGSSPPTLPPGHPASVALLEAAAALLCHGALAAPPSNSGARAAAGALRGLFGRRDGGEAVAAAPAPDPLTALRAVERGTGARLQASECASLTGWVAASAAAGALGERLALTAAALSTLPLHHHPWAALRCRNARADLAQAAAALGGVTIGGGGAKRGGPIAAPTDALSDVSTGDEAGADELGSDGGDHQADADAWNDLATVLEGGPRPAGAPPPTTTPPPPVATVTPLAPPGATHALYRVTCPPHPPATHRFRDVARLARAAAAAGATPAAPWHALAAETRALPHARLDAGVAARRAAKLAAALNAAIAAAGGVAGVLAGPGAAAVATLIGAPPPPAPRIASAGRATRLVLTLPPSKRPDAAVAAAQGGACAACSTPLTPPTTRCAHCDAVVCAACAARDAVPIPAAVLATFDFTPRRVCGDCADFLAGAATRPLLPVDATGPHLLARVPALAAAAAARRRALAALAAAKDKGGAAAAAAERLVRTAPPRRAHLLNAESVGFWSMADLEDVAGGPLALLPGWLDRVAAAATAAARVST